jgi:hypothetical protein
MDKSKNFADYAGRKTAEFVVSKAIDSKVEFDIVKNPVALAFFRQRGAFVCLVEKRSHYKRPTRNKSEFRIAYNNSALSFSYNKHKVYNIERAFSKTSSGEMRVIQR